MITPDEAQRQSVVINSLRFPATLLVIASHCIVTLKPTSLPYTLSPDNLFLILEQLGMSFGSIAVALFSLVTGYFFLYKYERYNLSIYLSLKKRFGSLLIPYVLWNLIAIAFLWAKNYIGKELDLSFAYNATEHFTLTHSSLLDLLLLPINGPLWYVREIIDLVLLSPIVYLIIVRRRLGALLVAGLFLMNSFTGGTPAYIPLFFILGAYLGYHKRSILAFAESLRYPSYLLGWIYPYLRIFYGGAEWASHVRVYALFFCIVACINLATTLYEKRKVASEYLASLSPAVFFMYAVHTVLIINLVRGTLYALFPWDDTMEKIVTLLLTATIVPCISYFLYKLLSKVTPRLSQILSGGRG